MKNLIITTTLLLALLNNFNTNAQVQTTQVNTVTVSIEKDDNTISINWNTMREVNTSYFIVEKSTDGVHYEMIHSIKAASSSLFGRQYSIDDTIDSLDTIIYYRIVTVLMGGERLVSNDVVYHKATNQENSSIIAKK